MPTIGSPAENTKTGRELCLALGFGEVLMKCIRAIAVVMTLSMHTRINTLLLCSVKTAINVKYMHRGSNKYGMQIDACRDSLAIHIS